VDHIVDTVDHIVDTVDHRMAVHRGPTRSPRRPVLHPVPGDEPVHHGGDGRRCVLPARAGHVRRLLPHLPGDGEATARPALPAGDRDRFILVPSTQQNSDH